MNPAGSIESMFNGAWAETFTLNAADTGTLLEWNYRKDCISEPELDRCRIPLILANLLSNAIQFSSEGRIAVSGQMDEQGLSVTIDCSGWNIKQSALERLFHPFIEASDDGERSNIRALENTGTGLTVAMRMTQKLDGTFRYEGRGADGCRFQLTFAAGKSDASNLSVLLVDDAPLNLKVLQILLTKIGCECHTAESGQQALEWLRTQTPDFVLTDLWMPDMDGLALTEEIRKLPQGNGIAIFVVTADSRMNHHGDLGKVDEFLFKPLTQEKLRRQLFPGKNA